MIRDAFDADHFAFTLKGKISDAKMDQLELARKCHIASGMVSYYASGKGLPSLETLRKIAKGLNCTTDELLGLDPPKKPAANPSSPAASKWQTDSNGIKFCQACGRDAPPAARYGEQGEFPYCPHCGAPMIGG